MGVREVIEADAEPLLRLQRRLDYETATMMLEPGERASGVEDVLAWIRRTLAAENSTIIVAADDDELVGYVDAHGGEYRRVRHCAYVVIGVLPANQGRGLGAALLAALEEWAVSSGLKRLELTVRIDNDRARRLYERAGYRVEGIRRCSLQVGAELIDEVAMARLLP